MKFGDNLKIIRKNKKMSQEELAERLNVSRQSVSKWENGESYPEMNNILQLCKIFNCKINDLIHTDMSDISSLDEQIVMSVVKFNEQEQKNMKIISSIISIFSKIMKIFLMIGIVVLFLCMIVLPVATNNIKVENSNIIIDEHIIGNISKIDNLIEITNYLENHSEIELIIIGESVLIVMIISLYLLRMLFNHLEKLFSNIHSNETPFTLENINHINKISFYLILEIFATYILSVVVALLFNIDFGIDLDLKDLIFVLVIISISFIFRYGYQIQKDSNGIMYNEKNDK